MEDHKDGLRLVTLCRTAQRLCAVLVVCLALHAAVADAAGPRRHFTLEAGDASFMLNEFSRQSDLQVLFDFNLLRGVKTHAVAGDLEASVALKWMLRDTNLVFDFVNDRTLAVMPKKPSLLERLWHRPKTRPKHGSDAAALEQVLISGLGENGTQPLLGAQTQQYSRLDIDRSGLATLEDFLRTMPQVFGGGPTQDTVLGREAGTNSARGSGVNIRGLDAGATLVLIDGKRMAPSGTAGAFDDISNIPLSIIDHIDLLTDGASAKYGADAMGGVVNFVTRSNFSGLQSQARGGGVTNGSMGERQFSQLFGNTRDTGKEFISFEYFQRDALRAADRSQYTSNLTPFGGGNFDTMSGSPGTITDGTRFWAIPKGQNGTALTAADLALGRRNLYDQYKGSDITPAEKRWSVFGKENQQLADGITLSLEGLFTRRNLINAVLQASAELDLSVPESNPFYVNPTGVPGPVTVIVGSGAYFGPRAVNNRIDTGNFSVGVTASIFEGWTANGYVAYAFERQNMRLSGYYNQAALTAALNDPDPATAFNPFGDGAATNPATLAAIDGEFRYDSSSSLRTAGLALTGPLLSLPAGELELGLGTEARIQDFEYTNIQPGAEVLGTGPLSRNVRAGFGELRVPIVGEDSQLGFARRIDLSLGARYEDYSDVGGSTVPKVGLQWSVNKQLSMRSTWTKSFKPPALTDTVASTNYSTLLMLPDPSSPTGSTQVLGLFGTNPGLQSETARTWSVGGDFAPKSVPGLSLSLTYFNILYSGRIIQALVTPDTLTQPGLDWLFNRGVSAAELSYTCTHTVFQGSQQDCLTSGVSTIVDNRLRNIASLKTDGLDLVGRYSFGTRAGKFDLGLNGTYLFKYAQANTPSTPLVNLVSTPTNPINIRARGSAAWTRRGFSISSFVNFENSYRDTVSVPNRRVSSWTTFDLQLAYEMGGDTPGWLDHTQFAVNTQNLFNVKPPFLNNGAVGLGYDQENADLYGRLVSFEIRKRW